MDAETRAKVWEDLASRMPLSEAVVEYERVLAQVAVMQAAAEEAGIKLKLTDDPANMAASVRILLTALGGEGGGTAGIGVIGL